MKTQAQRIFDVDNERGPALWKDRSGVTHQAEGDQMIPNNRGTFIMWTVCKKKDVPANKAQLAPVALVDCPECLELMK